MANTNNPSKVEYQPKTRQELYDMIRESSKDRVIRQEMIKYGFWTPKDKITPEDPGEAERLAEAQKELTSIRSELTKLHDIDALIRRARKERMEASRERQKETRERRIREREERAEAWKQAKERDIVYLGEGVSGGLSGKTSDTDKLSGHGLDPLHTAADVAQAMGLTVGQLRFLAFARKVSRTSHYQRFQIPKKSGGHRLISAPMPRLKAAQHWLLQNVLDRVEVHPAAHGFRHGRSIVTNATPHVGQDVVVNLDLKDFFPTITYKRACGVFKGMGYSEAVATIFALLSTEPEITPVEMDGQTFYIARGERHLPQGGPTSPAITNIICRRLDARLTGLAAKLGFTYTRYADDLTFSGAADTKVGSLLAAVRGIIKDEDFRIHPDKTRVCRKGRRQEVTGITVNEKLNVERPMVRKFRATLHQIELHGPEGKTWGHSDDLFASIEGYANFISMVNPEKGARYVAQVQRIRQKYHA